MIVTVHLFARFKDHLGARLQVELPAASTVADLRARLAADHPTLAGLLANSAIAVNHDFAETSQILEPADEIAVIPPVSGG